MDNEHLIYSTADQLQSFLEDYPSANLTIFMDDGEFHVGLMMPRDSDSVVGVGRTIEDASEDLARELDDKGL